MSITAASVEANGWVLRLTMAAGLGNFGSYSLDPGGSARVTLASAHPGFVKLAGVAVAGSIARSLVATKPLRKPANWNGSGLDAFVVDEVDLGGGSIQVRIALSEHIYASDGGLMLTVLAGWRTGEPAASIAVTNASTTVAPIPIMRWAWPAYNVVTGSFRLSLIVASHHPVGLEPVAGVRFTATDGTTTKAIWATALATDNDHGDNLRCYTVTIDPATATALTAGLLRCDAEVYPYLGTMRSTDPAGTRSMASLGTAGLVSAAEVPHVLGYDPAGTRYNARYIYVNPASTQTTSNPTMVKASLALAKAEPLSNQPANINTAINAIYNLNATLAAANGQPAQARSGDGIVIVLAAGLHVAVASPNPVVGVNTPEIPIRVIGDPDDSDPRNTVVWRTGSANGGRLSGLTKASFANMTMEIGGFALSTTSGASYWLDNVTVRGKSGATASTTVPLLGSNAFFTRMRISQTAWRPYVRNLARNIACSRTFACPVILKHRFIGAEEDGTIATSAVEEGMTAFSALSTAADLVDDTIIAYSDFRFLRAKGLNSNPTATAAAAGTPNPSLRRMLWLGNIFEKIGPTTDAPFYAIGENTSLTMSYNIIEGNTFVGDRNNSFYSEPTVTTLADCDTLLNQAFVNRIANNFFYWHPSKHDAFNDPETAALRGTGNGYRPQMVETWSYTYGVCHEGNCMGDVGQPFIPEFPGVRSVRGSYVPGWFSDDRSRTGSNLGGGSYLPTAGSPLLGLALKGSSDRDFANAARSIGGPAGAWQGGTGLAVNGSVHASIAGSPAVGWAGAIVPMVAVQASRAGNTLLQWFGGLLPHSAQSRVGNVSPALAAVGLGINLFPVGSTMGFGDLPAAILVPAGIPGAIRTLRIGADSRTILVQFT